MPAPPAPALTPAPAPALTLAPVTTTTTTTTSSSSSSSQSGVVFKSITGAMSGLKKVNTRVVDPTQELKDRFLSVKDEFKGLIQSAALTKQIEAPDVIKVKDFVDAQNDKSNPLSITVPRWEEIANALQIRIKFVQPKGKKRTKSNVVNTILSYTEKQGQNVKTRDGRFNIAVQKGLLNKANFDTALQFITNGGSGSGQSGSGQSGSGILYALPGMASDRTTHSMFS
jgi:hypothetical protein